MRKLPSLVFICTLVLGPGNLYPTELIQPEGSSAESEDGTLELEWSPKAAGEFNFRIERAANPSFENPLVVYEGPDTATFVSGLPEGHHYFRIREATEPWSDSVLTVEVKFVSKELVAALLISGAICLVLLLLALVRGQRRVNSEPGMRQTGNRVSKPLISSP